MGSFRLRVPLVFLFQSVADAISYICRYTTNEFRGFVRRPLLTYITGNLFSRTQFGFQIGDGGSDFWILAYNYKNHAEIYHKDDQNAHSSRKPTDPGFSELLGTSLVMPLIVPDKY